MEEDSTKGCNDMSVEKTLGLESKIRSGVERACRLPLDTSFLCTLKAAATSMSGNWEAGRGFVENKTEASSRLPCRTSLDLELAVAAK